jgi:hypothetical protein
VLPLARISSIQAFFFLLEGTGGARICAGDFERYTIYSRCGLTIFPVDQPQSSEHFGPDLEPLEVVPDPLSERFSGKKAFTLLE